MNLKQLHGLFAGVFIFLTPVLARAAGGQFSLGEGCSLKKFEDGAWRPADPSVIEGVLINPLEPKSGSVRFKVGSLWYSTPEGCLQAKAAEGDAPPPEAGMPRFSNPSSAHSSHPFHLAGLGGVFYDLTGTNNQIQLALGARAGVSFAESWSVDAQISLTSRNYSISGMTTTASYTEIVVIPSYRSGGLHLGPELGVGIRSASATVSAVFCSGFRRGVPLGIRGERGGACPDLRRLHSRS
ncbi:MAG: hypothetical protein EBX52_03125 [Proteobacteria bacterium]|nr:hypothetical protein [Pseudomonadota bacterium]